MESAPAKVLLIPGLFYPRWMLMPLRYTLRKKGFKAEVWDTTSVTAPLPMIVADLVAGIRNFVAGESAISLVTHSFGDWLARAALAQLPEGRIDRIASLVPVIAQSPAAQLAEPLLGRWLPPLRAMSDAGTASQGLPLPQGIQRKIIWARIDFLLRRTPPQTDPRTSEVYLWTTHNLLLADPRVHCMVSDFLRDPHPHQSPQSQSQSQSPSGEKSSS